MKLLTRRRLPVVLTGVLVLLAVAAVAVFLATGSPGSTASPTPTRAAGSGTEVLPPTATATTPHLGTTLEPLVTAPLPKSASAKGKLVTGFPSEIIPIPTGLKIATSSVATQGEHLQATVVGTSTGSEADVQSFYQAAFTKLGMTAAVSPAGAGDSATSYTRGSDSITVTTTATTSGTGLSIFGVFTAGKS